MKVLQLLCLIGMTQLMNAQKSADIQAIKSMYGCYEVSFDFAETFQYPKDSANYKASKTKHDKGLEWVELVEDSKNKLVLQHLLIVGPKTVIKHWRQDWLFENTELYDFQGSNTWKFISLPKSKVKGQWTQKVYQVDDSPRYEGSATWVHVDGRQFWQNTTQAPLPRREFSTRKDYDLLKRTNVHEIIENGWIHDQDNQKIIQENNQNQYVLAEEKGLNTYKKVDDSKCLAAQNWWQENQALWAKVRLKWDEIFAENKTLKLASKVDEKPLFTHLFALKPTATQAEVNQIIESFIAK
uniref:DUF6607 family protein n=1 Tax=Flavobacterium sp. TaxID=239 RepID=UPI00404A1A46